MDHAAVVRKAVRPGDYAVSLDLTDANLLVPAPCCKEVPPLCDRRRGLRLQGSPLRPLPRALGLHSADGHSRGTGSPSHFSRDLLLPGRFPTEGSRPLTLRDDLDTLLTSLRELGFPCQPQQVRPRAVSGLHPPRDEVPDPLRHRRADSKRIENLLLELSNLRARSFATPRQVHRVLGLAVSAANLLFQGWARIRPLQWAVTTWWYSNQGDWDNSRRLPLALHDALQSWEDPPWLAHGIPLVQTPPAISICTDASGTGWGALLLHSLKTCHGLWSAEESDLHSNILELLAVHRALYHWLPLYSGKPIMIVTDNTTVCAYIRHRAEHTRAPCARGHCLC